MTDTPQNSDQQFPETNRRCAAVEVLLARGWKWDGVAWAEPAPAVAPGLEMAAKWVDARRHAFEQEHGRVCGETGAMEFGRGKAGEAAEDYAAELSEIAEGIRGLARPVPDAGSTWPHAGRDALWEWFGLSYASFLTMPRALMHAMPDEWQAAMAKLCGEWDAHWSYSEESPLDTLGTPAVMQRMDGGRFKPWPDFLLDYRHPNREAIEQCRAKVPRGTEPRSK